MSFTSCSIHGQIPIIGWISPSHRQRTGGGLGCGLQMSRIEARFCCGMADRVHGSLSPAQACDGSILQDKMCMTGGEDIEHLIFPHLSLRCRSVSAQGCGQSRGHTDQIGNLLGFPRHLLPGARCALLLTLPCISH